MQEREEFEQRAKRLKTLTEPCRLQPIIALFDRVWHVGALASICSVDIATASPSLGLLLKAGIVTSRRRGRLVP